MSPLLEPILVQGIGSLLLVLLCGAVYAFRRQTYFLYWSLAWLSFSLWLLLDGVRLNAPEGSCAAHPVVRAVLQDTGAVCSWWHVVLWLLGVRAFWTGRRVRGRDLAVILGVAAVGAVAVSRLSSQLMDTPVLAAVSRGLIQSAALALVYGLSAFLFIVAHRRLGQHTALPGLTAAEGPPPLGRGSRLGTLLLAVGCVLYTAEQLQYSSYRLAVLGGAAAPGHLGALGYVDLLLQLVITTGMIVVLLSREQDELQETLTRLAESETRFRLVFEHGGVGMALLTRQGDLLEVNPAFVRLLGYAPDELRGRRLGDFAHPEETPTDLSVVRAGSSGDVLHERERRYRHKDGHTVWANVLRVPVRDAARRVQYLVAVLVDITARKHAEERLREQRDFTALVLETADALIMVLDTRGHIVRCNKKCCAVSGYEAEQLVGRPFWEFLLPQGQVEAARERFRKLVTEPLRQATPLAHEGCWRTRGGEERLIAWRTTPGYDAEHRLTHVIETGLDVTDQKRLEEQLRQAQKMETLGTLVGGIAHDFNNQLTAILGNLELGRRLWSQRAKGGAEDEANAALRDAELAARRCADMTRSLLTFSRHHVTETRPVDLNAVVQDSCRLLRRVLPGTIRLDVLPGEEVWPASADSTQIHQVLMNLVVNARDAMGGAGIVKVMTGNRTFTAEDCLRNVEARPGRFVELTVRDTGPGIAPGILGRIFEPFFTTKPVGQGTGLGLAMVFGIVKAHRGWVTVESEPGHGATFRVYLPAADEAARGERDHCADGELAGERAGAKEHLILVVDDEEYIRRLAQTVLERAGFRVVAARDGHEALALYRQRSAEIAAIVLDLTMPGMTGLQVLQATLQINPGVRVIFSSGYAAEGDREQLLAVGARAFVPKPYRLDELSRAVREVLEEP
jgi:PAS domain S-box-containing protein